MILRREFLLCGSLCAIGQEPVDIRTTVRLVLVPVSVTDPDGQPVDGLEEGDFRVAVDGRAMPHRLEIESQPLSVVVAIQTNENARPVLAKILEIAGMIPPAVVGEGGELALISYGRGGVRLEQEFTTDADAFLAAVGRLRPRGHGTLQLDAVRQAVRGLAGREKSRQKVLLILGEKRDQGSEARIAEVAQEAGFANVQIYGAVYSPFLSNFTVRRSSKVGKEDDTSSVPAYEAGAMDLLPLFRGLGNLGKASTMEVLVHLTGGLMASFTKQKSLEATLARIGEDLHRQYLVSFIADTGNPLEGEAKVQYREIAVTVPGRPKAVVRHRSGYWGP